MKKNTVILVIRVITAMHYTYENHFKFETNIYTLHHSDKKTGKEIHINSFVYIYTKGFWKCRSSDT